MSRSLQDLARALGGEATGGQVLCPGPGHGPGDRSLSVKFSPGAPDGFVIHSFADNDPIVCRDHVKRLTGIRHDRQHTKQPPPPRAVKSDDVAWKLEAARKIWAERQSIAGTIAEAYLMSRAVALMDDVLESDALGYHRDCPLRIDGARQRRPALVAKMVDVHSNAFRGIHRTFIKALGSGKDDTIPGGARRMLGSSEGAVCKLSRDEEVTTVLGIGEGIETTLSLFQLPECHGITVWACLSSTNLAAFRVLAGIEVLWVAVDREASGEGERAAQKCAERWNAAGAECILVRVKTSDPKRDLNDVIRERLS
jgi:putative DNA primase/helicase